MCHVQDTPVSTNMISNEIMIYHMKVHMVRNNFGSKKFSKSKKCNLAHFGQTQPLCIGKTKVVKTVVRKTLEKLMQFDPIVETARAKRVGNS